MTMGLTVGLIVDWLWTGCGTDVGLAVGLTCWTGCGTDVLD